MFIKNNIYYHEAIINNDYKNIYHGGRFVPTYFNKLFENANKNKNKNNINCGNCSIENNNTLLAKINYYIQKNKHDFGLKWIYIGKKKPQYGTEIFNETLKNALKNKQQFSHTEYKTFNLNNLYLNNFIFSNDFYFKPQHNDKLYEFLINFEVNIYNTLEGNSEKLKCKTLFNYINIYVYLILYWINFNFILPSFDLKIFNKINCIDNSNAFIFNNKKENTYLMYKLLIYKFKNLWNNSDYINNNKLLFEKYFIIINKFLEFIKNNKYINNIGTYDINYFINCFKNNSKHHYTTFNENNCTNFNNNDKIYCIFKKNKYNLNYIISYILIIYQIIKILYLNQFVDHIKFKYKRLDVDKYIINSDINSVNYHITTNYKNTPSLCKISCDIQKIFQNLINKNDKKWPIEDSITREDCLSIFTISILKYNNELLNTTITKNYNSLFDIIDSNFIYDTLYNWDEYFISILKIPLNITDKEHIDNLKQFFIQNDCNYKYNYDDKNITNLNMYDDDISSINISDNLSTTIHDKDEYIRKWLNEHKTMDHEGGEYKRILSFVEPANFI
tara:strand:- start:314 stop:1993 length:1680 start_codon:yes stop_codon:yes gene_type:complete